MALSAVISQEVDFFIVWIDVNNLKLRIIVESLLKPVLFNVNKFVLFLNPLQYLVNRKRVALVGHEDLSHVLHNLSHFIFCPLDLAALGLGLLGSGAVVP